MALRPFDSSGLSSQSPQGGKGQGKRPSYFQARVALTPGSYAGVGLFTAGLSLYGVATNVAQQVCGLDLPKEVALSVAAREALRMLQP